MAQAQEERPGLKSSLNAPESSPRGILRLSSSLSDFQGLEVLPLSRIMDPTPFMILEDMPAPRLYALFAKAGERAGCVVSRSGEFRGLISRDGLITAARKRKDYG